jgi:DNA-binding NarL/FixJ family response regulator
VCIGELHKVLSMKNEHWQQEEEEQRQQRQQESVQWRRDKVLELNSQGHSQREISTILHIGIGTVNRNII